VSAALLAALVLTQGAGTPLDEGTLVVRMDTQEVARESFRLLSRHATDSTSGWLLAARVRWVATPPVTFATKLALGPDTAPEALEYTVAANGASQRITGQPGPGRYTLRYVAPGLERARELARGDPTVIVDDSVFAPFLVASWLASPTPRIITAIYPRTARRLALTVTDLGIGVTTLNRDPATLRHVLIAGGDDGPVHVWLSPEGRLMKVEVPARALRAERLPG
jgi:hypothetical protein